MADPEKQDHDERAPRMREATATVIRRIPAAKRDETDEEKAAREAQGEEVVEIAISSEAPVRRFDWWNSKEFDEVLLHGPGEIDLSYARDGLPFFVDHNSRDMVGIVEDLRLDSDRILRGTVRFSKSARAREIQQDILDGIRKKISVGYDYDEKAISETTTDGLTERRVRGWRPLEASSVPIPADYEVGVGRSARPGARRPEIIPGAPAPKAKENNVSEQATAAPAAADVRAGVVAEHREIAELAQIHQMTERLPAWFEKGLSVAQVQREILDAHRAKSEALLARGGGGDVLDLTPKQEQQFSFARAIQSQLEGRRGFEQEVSEELYKKTGRKRTNPHAILVPTQLLGRLAFPGHQRANMAVATSGAGQQLKFTEYGGFLEILRNRMYLLKLGARTMSGLQGDVSFVTQTSANSWQWGAETAAASSTNFGTGIKTLAPKDGSGLTGYTRKLLAQSVESIEGFVQEDLMKVYALAVDLAGIAGSGSTQPTGIISTSGIGSVTMGTAGAVPTFPKLIDMETEIVTDNADAETMAYLTTPGIRGYLKKTEEFSATSGRPIWTTQAGVGYVNGFPAFASNQVPSNGTKGSNTGTNHSILFGDFSNVIIGEWGGIEIIVDPYTSKSTIIEVGMHAMVDVLLRYPEGLCAMVDARTS